MLTNYLESLMIFGLTTIWLLLLRVKLSSVAIYVIKDGVLNSSEIKTAVKHSSAIIFISLPETRVLMQLCQNFIQTWHWRALVTNLLSFDPGPCFSLFQILVE